MYKYVYDISKLSHSIIENYSGGFCCAVDATLGNGFDTDFLSEKFSKVYSFDIQKDAIENYEKNKKENVVLINDSHEFFGAYINEKIDCIMYNLGFLPGGNKEVTTTADTTMKSLQEGLAILNPGGIISIAVYVGHAEGLREKNLLLEYVGNIPKKEFGVMVHYFANRNNAPLLIIIEKNNK
ncbi:putative rRNA methylase [Clostridiales bacterium oral taxon 876 str. F0540]|nr:putative rRNA methylase [Clostridiales bacterium oral taxon 876 str. F0540]